MHLSLLETEIAKKTTLRRIRLNQVMQNNHITLEELARMTGVSKSSIQRYLTGDTSKIPIDFFEKVASVTNTPIEYLTCFEDEQKSKSSWGTAEMEEYERLCKKISKMNAELVNKIAASDPRSDIKAKIDKLSDSQLDRLIGYLEALLAE